MISGGGARVVTLPPNPAAMLSAREAHQRSFQKRPFRVRLLPSCLSANQRELSKIHECLLEHFGIVFLLSFRSSASESALKDARCGRSLRIFDFNPGFRGARAAKDRKMI